MGLIIRNEVSLAPYTLYKIGGPARFLAEPKNRDELVEAIAFAERRGVPFFILGGGSNVLIYDGGFEGLVVRMPEGSIRAEGAGFMVDAGVTMARAVLESVKYDLSGFEWGIGIPGTVGGSVRGNAGCFGGEMKDVISSVEMLDTVTGAVRVFSNLDCVFSYRHSIFKHYPEWIILSAALALKQGDPELIRAEVKRITVERTVKQDIGTKTCGCIFKNIPWSRVDVDRDEMLHRFPEFAAFAEVTHIPASFLIDRAGLKGTRVGQSIISPKHANFFVNEGGASSVDVTKLIRVAKETVFDRFGLLLEEEIQYVGFKV